MKKEPTLSAVNHYKRGAHRLKIMITHKLAHTYLWSVRRDI